MNYKHQSAYLLRCIVVIGLLLFCNFFCQAQTGEVTSDEEVVVINDSVPSQAPIRKKDKRPRNATIMSAVIPGLGQVYNKKYWKVPIIYGLGGAIGYFFHFENVRYKVFKAAYEDTINFRNKVPNYVRKAPVFFDGDSLLGASPEALKDNRNFYRRNRDLSIVLMAGLYLLNLLDAQVDAHLRNFDVSDDLALQFVPRFNAGINNSFAPGISLNLKFKK